MRIAILLLSLVLEALPARSASGEPSPPKAAADATCGAHGYSAAVSLQYKPNVLGSLGGLSFNIRYPRTLSLPGAGIDKKVAERVTSLVGPDFDFISAVDDNDADGRQDLLRIIVVTKKGAVPPADVARIRFDCEPGSTIAPSDLECRPEQIADGQGQLFPKETASQVSCSVSALGPVTAKKES